MDVFLSTRMIVKSYGPVGALMVMVKECTDHMDNFDIQRTPQLARTVISLKVMDQFDIQRAPTVSENGQLFKSDGPIRYTTSPHS